MALIAAPAALGQAAPIVEVNADHPLFVFAAPSAAADAQGHANQIVSAWASLSDELKPFAAFDVRIDSAEQSARHTWMLTLLERLEETEVPVIINAAAGSTANYYPLALLEQLVTEFNCVKGVSAYGLQFNEYSRFGGGEEFAKTPSHRWLQALIPVAAKEQKIVLVALDEVNWPRIMAAVQYQSLYETIRKHADFVVPVAYLRDGHTTTQISGLMGMQLEGACASWGIAPSPQWFKHADFIEPGVFGVPEADASMPPAYYRAMMLNGAMTGATAYLFPDNRDLWYGVRPEAWRSTLQPLLSKMLTDALIARPEFIRRKAQVAYQLASSPSSEEFHLNLRDIDPILDEGLLFEAAYGVERAVQVPELVPNTGLHYWIPLLSPSASQEVRDEFVHVVAPGVLSSAGAWRELLAGYYKPESSGEAFVVRIGRGVFVLHTHENLDVEQSFTIPEMPAPVRVIEATRTDDGVRLTWPFREGDIAWSVWRRSLPAEDFALLAPNLDERQFLDTEYAEGDTVAYSVSAVTSETEPFEGTLRFGDYHVFSAVESRLAEEVVISPLSQQGTSRPIMDGDGAAADDSAWWPNTDDLPDEQQSVANEIAGLIVEWDNAVRTEQLDRVMQLYALEYNDPQGWGYGYARRAFQWFFERYDFCRMDRQIRSWDFERFEQDGEVAVTLYTRFSGTAITDSTGERADLRIFFPRGDRESRVTFSNASGPWRIIRTNPPLPNFRDVLSPVAGAFNPLPPGPDVYTE